MNAVEIPRKKLRIYEKKAEHIHVVLEPRLLSPAYFVMSKTFPPSI
jgi:hypothetical protein